MNGCLPDFSVLLLERLDPQLVGLQLALEDSVLLAQGLDPFVELVPGDWGGGGQHTTGTTTVVVTTATGSGRGRGVGFVHGLSRSQFRINGPLFLLSLFFFQLLF